MPDSDRWRFPEQFDDETTDAIEDVADTLQDSLSPISGGPKEEAMRWLSEAITMPAPLPPDLPASLDQDSFEQGGFTIPIYQTERLTEENGRWPEYVVSRSLANALDHASRNYSIRYGFEPLPAPTERPKSKEPDLLTWFAERDDRPVEGHVNLLLTFGQKGVGVTGGNNCVAGVSALTPGTDPMGAGKSDEARHQYAALHEVGHALGVPGDADPSDETTQTLGVSWVENGNWHKTLICSTESGGENVCGESLSAREGQPIVYHNRFSDCAVESFFSPEDLEDDYELTL